MSARFLIRSNEFADPFLPPVQESSQELASELSRIFG